MAYSEKLSSALSKIMVRHSFWATILMQQCELIEASTFPGSGDEVPTAATDGKHIVISPELVEQSTVNQLVFVLAHEIGHVMFLHCLRGKQWHERGHGPDGKPFNRMKWAYAIDYIVNALLSENKVGEQYDWVLRDSSVTGHEMVEDVYCKLPDPPQIEKPGDSHIDPDGELTEEKKLSMEGTIKQAISNARAMGEDPGTIAHVILKTFEAKVSWQDVLRQEVTRKAQSLFDDWKRINRRKIAQGAPFIAPGRRGVSAGELVVVLDTSGSCIDEVGAFISELRKIYEDTPPSLTHILWVDSRVAHVDVVDDIFQLEEVVERVIEQGVPGGGGTDMTAAFRWAQEKGVQPNQMIVFTDGYTPFGKEQPYPVIWAVTVQSMVSAPPFGTKVFVDTNHDGA